MANGPEARRNKRRRIKEIVDHFHNAIIAGEYKSGDQLPNSIALRKQFNAHTGILAEARLQLVNRGLVEVKIYGKKSNGTYVK